MRKKTLSKRIQTFVFAVVMVVSTWFTYGPKVEAESGDTGLASGTDIDTSDTISLPIKIYDYLNDGMLFEYAQNTLSETAEGYSNGAPQPEVKQGLDYTMSAAYSSVTYKNYEKQWAYGWFDTTKNSAINNVSPMYMNITNDDDSMDTAYITQFGNAIELEKARYIVLVYRTHNISNGSTVGFWVEDATSGAAGKGDPKWTYMQPITPSETEWKYLVYDLHSIGENDRDIFDLKTFMNVGIYLPGFTEEGQSLDFSHVAYFSSPEEADDFGNAAVEFNNNPGIYCDKWVLGDNTAFGLLRMSQNTPHYESVAIGRLTGTDPSHPSYDCYDNSEDNTIYHLNDAFVGESFDMSSLEMTASNNKNPYKLYSVLTSGLAVAGLTEPVLEDGRLVYREETVEYVADILKKALAISEINSDGSRNYSFVRGAESSKYGNKDLAQWFRDNLNGEMGTFAESDSKELIGTWDQCSANIDTYCDAAYYMLNNIFVANSYNTAQTDYEHLVLSKGQVKVADGTTQEAYIFDGGFTNSNEESAVEYDKNKKIIRNTSATDKTMIYYDGSNLTTLFPFLPIEGETRSPYFLDDGVNGLSDSGATYKNRNYNYTMQANGEFVYHADDNLFFQFEGDDDVYLYINGQLVMDMGATHSITTEYFYLNDYVKAAQERVAAGTATDRDYKLALEEGKSYSFDFFYMERHGWGANTRIATNIPVTNPAMLTEKTAYQDNIQLNYGAIVNKDNPVEYGFTITNNGNTVLEELRFADSDIGITLDSVNGLSIKENYNGTRVFDTTGDKLDASDLYAIVSGDGYDDIKITFDSNDSLKNFLKNLTGDALKESGGGLRAGSSVQIRGFAYKLTEEQIKSGSFKNVVLTSATASGTLLSGQADMKVYVPADPMYYQWAGKKLNVSLETLKNDIKGAAGNPAIDASVRDAEVTINGTCLANGTKWSYDYAKVVGENIEISYPTAGSYVFYVKITYTPTDGNTSTDEIPVLINVTDVEDSVYVLDYGLKAELTENGELLKNDTLSVPGRDTAFEYVVTQKDVSYEPNSISFSESDIVSTAIEKESGTFTVSSNKKLLYTPTKFMNTIDTINLVISVHETKEGTDNWGPVTWGNTDINNEVQMYKSVSVLPANVVYYEDDFPAISYTDKNNEEAGNQFTKIGNGSIDEKQSVDQSQEYGQDEVYSENTDMSGGSLTTITIDTTGVVASFEFTGTGFELISRTNANDSADLYVKILNLDKMDEQNNPEVVKIIPVITEFDNKADGGKEEIYQVPVIRVDDLGTTNADAGHYKVEIYGIPAYDWDNGGTAIINKKLYIDGLRIFQPMGSYNSNYIPEENGAAFFELRDLIVEANAAVAEQSGDKITVSAGTTTWVENRNGSYTQNIANSINDYLLAGPNNEVYMDGQHTTAATVFYVQEDDKKDVHNLQIAIRGIDYGLFYGGMSTGVNAPIYYGIKSGDTYEWTPLVTATSATEQYYTIDYTKCPIITIEGNTVYQIALLVDTNENVANGSEIVPAMASYSSIKLNGLDYVSVSNAVTIEGDDSGFFSLKAQLMSRRVATGNPVEDDTDNEDNSDVGDVNNDANGTGGSDESSDNADNNMIGNSSGNGSNSDSGNAFSEAKDEKVPTAVVDTGDYTNITLYAVMLLVAGTTIVAVLAKRCVSHK